MKRKRFEHLQQGIAFTVGNPGKIPQATSCLIQALQSILSDNTTNTTDDKGLSFSDMLDAEFDQMRSNKKRFLSGGDLCRGIAFVKVQHSHMKPSELVYKLLKDESHPLPAYISRIMPFDFVNHPHFSDAVGLVNKDIKPFFEKIEKPTSWTLKFSKHAMGSIDKTKLIQYMMEVLPERHEATIMGAEYTVLVDVTPIMCGMSVVKDYEELEEYNVAKLAQKRAEKTLIDDISEHEEDQS